MFLSLSLAERAPAGARDKSPEQVGPGWGEAGERGGKKEKDRTAVTVTSESRGAGSKCEGAGGGP